MRLSPPGRRRALEIERLEREAEQAAETLAAAQRATQEATYPS
jgi:hypothetical protein